MNSVEERVAYIEGRLMEQSATFDDIRQTLSRMETRMDARLGALDHRLDAMHASTNAALAGLDRKLDQRFSWLVRLQMGTFATIVAMLLAALLAR